MRAKIMMLVVALMMVAAANGEKTMVSTNRQKVSITECIAKTDSDTLLSCEEYFCTVSSKDIPDMSLDSITFITSNIDSHFSECGTVSDPVFDYDIQYDTLSRYQVVVCGTIIFGKDTNPGKQYERVDSVGIRSLFIWNKNSKQREYYSCEYHRSHKKWEDCPLPPYILTQIKNDFLIRMKYTRYSLGKGLNIMGGIALVRHYMLYPHRHRLPAR